MSDVRIEHGDMLQVIPRLVAEGVVCDSCVCDPPYHLTIPGRFAKTKIGDHTDAGRRAAARSDAAGRLSAGFMGKAWDGGDIAFRPETWATVATIMRPGAFLVAFGGTRTHHRVWCAIEDAGFVIQDTIMWLFGSGFPKRRDMLKPALEPICLAYKPGGNRTMQVDECRIEGPMDGVWGTSNQTINPDRKFNASPGMHEYRSEKHPAGRWPANLIHDGSDEVLAAFPEAPGAIRAVTGAERSKKTANCYGDFGRVDYDSRAAYDGGSVARFYYSAKASSDDRFRSRHPTIKPVSLMRWLVRLVTPPGGLVIDPFSGSGATAGACVRERRDCVAIEREAEYVADIRRRLTWMGQIQPEAREPEADHPGPRSLFEI